MTEHYFLSLFSFWWLFGACQSSIGNSHFLRCSGEAAFPQHQNLIINLFVSPWYCSLEQLITCYLMCLYAAFFMTILLHIGVLHGYMNFVGEIMRFADRQFYQVNTIIIILYYACV